MSVILAVDANVDVNLQHETEWRNRYGIDSLRVNTMREAGTELARGGEFLFVVINEDNINHVESNLSALRGVTDTPIFVLTSNYAIDKKIRAMYYGADLYEAFSAYVKDELRAGLTYIRPRGGHARPNRPQDIICGDILLSPSRHRVLVNDTEVSLTKKEFDILYQLMLHHNCVATHLQLLQSVWGDEYGINDVNLLWRTMERLRKKLSRISPAKEYVKVKRGVGYSLSMY